MATAIRTLVVLDSGVDADTIARAIPNNADIDVVGVVQGIDAAARALEDTICDVLVIACIGYSDRVLFLTESAVQQEPTRPVIVLSDGSPNGFVRRVFEVGADDIVMLPQEPEHVRFAIEKALARKRGSGRTSIELGRLVVVLGPKGGTGKTLVATNLAVALQEAGKTTVLVDLDLQFGDVALCMGLLPGKTIHELVTDGGALDSVKLESHLTTHSSGVRTLLAPNRPDKASAVTVEAIRDAFAILRQLFDVVVVDTPPGFTPEVIASIDMSTDLVMVGMLDSLSLKNTKLGLETLELMGYEPEDIRLVLNRAHTQVGISSTDVTAVLGSEPEVLIPSNREIPRTVNEGVPIIIALPRSKPAEAFRRLASFYTATNAEPEQVEESATPAGSRRTRVFGRRG